MVQHITTPPTATPTPTQQPTGRMNKNAIQSIPQGVPTIITYDQISNGMIGGTSYGNHFNDGIEDVANNWILPGVEGYYQINAQVEFTIYDGDGVTFQLFRGSCVIASKVWQIWSDPDHSSIISVYLHISDVVWMSNIDYVLTKLTHSAATNCIIGPSSGRYDVTFLSVQRVR